MACTTMRHWTRLLTILSLTRIATVQYAVPMFAAPPVLPVMLPALALGPPQSRAPSTTTSTTTTTTARSVAVAVPVGVPLPVPFPLPVYAQPDFCRAEPRPTACPACPPCHCTPSCTPAFFSFCSPCHQRCRCRNPNEAPVPMPPSPPVALAMHSYPVPLPAPAPAPLVVVPMPPLRVVNSKTKRKPRRYSSSDTSRTSEEDWSEFSSDDGLSSSDSDYFYKKIRRKKKSHKKRRRYSSRRNIGRADDGEVVKPVLTYVSQNGNIKFKTKISNAQAAHLLGARRAPAPSERPPAVETVQVVAHEDPQRRPRVVVVSNTNREQQRGAGTGPRRIELREGARSPHDLRPGKKEIVFRPPYNKRISNLSVSFQVSE
ncbi:max-binding protein MNT-like [Papilio machaon]|uniref:max-binding protein MNT-like n=1 Tax=Papilio machaon TaxID=76193 RepID=UPI001E663FF2|nr:max-binding protein MNT-like [Papilio machaon]